MTADIIKLLVRDKLAPPDRTRVIGLVNLLYEYCEYYGDAAVTEAVEAAKAARAKR